MQPPLLTEEMRKLMGLGPRLNGGLPVLFQRGRFEEGGPAPKAAPRKTLQEDRLDEASMRLFKQVKEMAGALDRAHRLVSRVNASVLRTRESSQNGMMNEKARADMYRLDQEISNAMDSIRAAEEALTSVEKQRKISEADRKQARSQGRV